MQYIKARVKADLNWLRSILTKRLSAVNKSDIMIVKSLQEFRTSLQPHAPLLGIDYGKRKIGIALSNHERTMAMPLKVINTLQDSDKIKHILDLIKLYKICGLVVGMPIDMNGIAGQQCEIVMKFTEALDKEANLPIYMQDERLSSKAADSLLKSIGINRKERNNSDDAIASSIILDSALQSMSKQLI